MRVFTAFLILVVLSRAAEPRSFEVVSVKPNKSGGSYGIQTTPGGRFVATNVSPMMLIRKAFGLELYQLGGGPDWINTERYDVECKTAGARDITGEELRPLLQKLLAERFVLKFHRETRQVPVYLLGVAKNGAKLTVHTGDTGPSLNTDYSAGKSTLTARNTTIEEFTKALSRLPGRPVQDNTGIHGAYDFKLEWSPDQTGDFAAPSLFTALQEQLGLKLEAANGPVEMLVIDSVERPSEN